MGPRSDTAAARRSLASRASLLQRGEARVRRGLAAALPGPVGPWSDGTPETAASTFAAAVVARFPCGGCEMKVCGFIVVLGLALLITPVPASAQPVPVPETWGGDFMSRARLTGNWGGFRDELGKKGVVFDADLLLTPQGVASGGRDTEAEFWGNAEYTLNVDTGKAGLWPGGFLRLIANSGFGDSVLQDSGAINPVNTAALLPAANAPTTALMHATFMQFLSPKFGLVAGKFFTLDGDPGEFTGNYRTQFQNGALVFPMTAALVPISAYGGGIVAIPWEGAVLPA